MNYHPEGMYLWDTWYCNKGDEVHAFYLQRKRPGSERSDVEEDSIGHAVSRNLLDWEEKPIALSPGPKGSADDLTLYTGCTYEHNNEYYLYYTMRSSVNSSEVQQIGLARSNDMFTWEKEKNNPVIVPDERWYCGINNPARYGIVDCRDLIIVKEPEGAVIACVYSRDLIHWEHMPPVFSPSRYSIVEVPDVFNVDGKWYMTCLVNNRYGNREQFPEKELSMGTIYAVADSITGPYKEEEGNILIASMCQNGLSCRTVMYGGKRYLFYTQPERLPETESGEVTTGTLTTPKELKVIEGKLRACYSDLIEQKTTGVLFQSGCLPGTVECRIQYETPARWQADKDCISGVIRACWGRYQFNCIGENFIYSANVCVKEGVGAGLVFRQKANGYDGGVLLLDYERQAVLFCNVPDFQVMDCRKVYLEHGRTYNVKVVAKGRFIEMYLDDILVIQSVCYFVTE